MKSKKTILSYLACFLILLYPVCFPVFAQTTITPSPTPQISPVPSPVPTPTPTPSEPSVSFLTISPPVRELELPRGSSNSYQMSILNKGDSSVRLILRASPFIAIGDTGGVSVADEGLPSSQDWIIVNPNLLTLNPGERREITYTITVPKNAEPGGFYFAVTALLAGKSDVGGKPTDIASGAAVNLNVASLNLVTIEGPVTYDAQITEFFTPKTFFEYGPVPLTARIRNLSTVHIKPLLEVEIKNTLGFLNDGETIHIKQQNILPQAQRKFEAEFGGKWHFGRYAATLSGLYGDGQTLTHTLFFWIVPWKAISATVLAVVIVVLLLNLLYRRIKRRREELEEKIKELEKKLEEKPGA